MEKEAANARKAGKLDHGSIERLSAAPKLPLEHEFYIIAFRTLSSDKQAGFNGAGRIGWNSVKNYGEFYNLSKLEIEELWFVVSAMDSVLSETNSKAQAPAK